MDNNANDFFDEKRKIINDLSSKSIMVLATSAYNIVTARSISVFIYNDKIYFQTGNDMVKMEQIQKNNNIALCCDNYQIQGKAINIGNWDNNKDLLPYYINKHESSYKLYGKMKEQIVVEIKIEKVKRWDYINQKPFIGIFDFMNNQFSIAEYIIE